jgi:chromosome partitioning protein
MRLLANSIRCMSQPAKVPAKVIAVYSLKGGVGKTTMAVNVAVELARTHKLRTLLWDLDPQSAASFILGKEDGGKARAQSLFEKEVAPEKLIRPTQVEGLDLLAADSSLRGLDGRLLALGKKRRLAKLIGAIADRYDRIILDCPPGLTETSEQVVRAANVIIAPLIPSALSRRALDEVVAHLKAEHKGHAPILPVYAMVDRRRSLHKSALEMQLDWPTIPMASAAEQMAERRMPLALFAPTSPAALAFAALTGAIEHRLAMP